MAAALRRESQRTRKREKAINKKILFIIVGLFALVLGGELLLPVLEELGFLALEWAHKLLDILFEDVLRMEEEAAKKASAYTLYGILPVVLLVWGGYKLYHQYQRMKLAFPQWWVERKAELHHWWADLPWLYKLAYVLGGLGLVGILAMII